MATLLGKEIGSERIGYETLLLLINNLNDALEAEDVKWNTLDQSLAQAIEIDWIPCTSNPIKKHNFYLGHRPSLIEASIHEYPNVSVMADQAMPSSDQGDWYEGFQIRLWIEAMVIDGPYDQKMKGYERAGEDLCNRKAQRVMEALHNVLVSNRTLSGIIEPITDPPRAFLSNCIVRSEDTSYGSDYFWQMARLEYIVKKVSAY